MSGNTSTVTPPAWQSTLTSLLSAGAGAVTTVAPLINGQPAPPANPAATVSASGTVAAATSFLFSPVVLLIAAAGAVWFFFFRKKSRR